MLLTIPALLSPSQLVHAQQLLANASWLDGRITAGVQAAQVKNNEQLADDHEATRAVRAMVLASLDSNPVFFSAALPKKMVPPFVNRYGGRSNFYGAHVDNAIRVNSGTAQRVRTDISCTVFLNCPTEYDGGELSITAAYGEQSIKLEAGSAVFYPGTSVHQVKPVTRGHRFACFFWIESLVRNDAQRQILYELDMNLLTLRERHGETAETTALTGTYHNLLRMWADT